MIHKLNIDKKFSRRLFNKVAGATLVLPSAALATESGVNPWINYPEFLNLYKTIDLKGKPQSVVVDLKTKYCVLTPATGRLPERYVGGSHIKLTDWGYKTTGRNKDEIKSKLYRDAVHTLLAAATDRNIIVYNDNYNSLAYDMRKTMTGFINTKIPIHFFLGLKENNEKTSYKYEKDGMNHIHVIPSIVWNQIEDFYISKLRGSYPQDRKKLVIAVTQNNKCIHVKYNEPHWSLRNLGYQQENSIAVLNNDDVILGAY
jgi:hypothetical protein